MTVLLLALALLVGSSGVAEAGPIASFIAVGLMKMGVGFYAATAIGGFLVNSLGSMAMSALSMALRGKPEQPKQAGITTETTTAGGTVPQRLIFGRYCTAGQHVCPPMTYETDDDPNEFLVYVISLADKPVTGLGRVFIDGQALTINGNPAASANGDSAGVTVIDPPDAEYSDKFWIRFHDGTQTTADAYLRRVAGTYPERPWTADMVGQGVAYAVVTFRAKAEEQTYRGFPSIKFEVDGHRLRDPRTGTDVFTRNPAVIAWNILRGIDVGGQTWGVGATNFLMPHVLAAANLCDQSVPVAGGGTRPRYQAGLEISVADEPHEALMEMVKAFGGDVADMGGTWLLAGGDSGAHVLSITDDDIIVTDSRNLRPYPGLNETVNAIHASYPEPAQQWEAKEAVPLYNAAYEAADGGRRLIAEVDFPAVPYPRQVRALMREMLADHRRHRTHVITLPPDALGVNLAERIAWTSEVNGYISKLFKVVAKRVDPQSLCVALTITEVDPSDYDYDADSDGLLPVIPSPLPLSPVIVGVPGFQVDAITIPGDAGIRPGIRILWNGEIAAQGVFWEVQRDADGTVVSTGTERNVAGGRKVLSEGILPATTYRVRGQLIVTGRDTVATPWHYVTTHDARLGWDDLTDDVRTDVTNLETWLNGTGDLIRQVMDEVGLVRDQMLEGDSDAFNDRQQIRADLDMVALDNAQALDALVVRVTDTEAGIVTQADAITAVEAKTDAASAGGLFRVSAEATPAGSQSRIGLRAEATAGGATHSAALYLEAKSDGTNQAGFVADRFFIASSSGEAATRAVPFVVDNGNVYLDNAYLGNTIQSVNFVSGPAGSGWRILRNGTAEFNDVIIRRTLQKTSGTLNVGNFIPTGTIPDRIVSAGGGGTGYELRYPTGSAVNLSNGPGRVEHILSSAIPITEWQGITKTYIATAGMTGTVTSDQAPNAYWGWTADVLPLTRWEGNQSLRIKLSFWSIGVTAVQNCVVTVRVYEVS